MLKTIVFLEMPYFRVLHNFDAQDIVELTVKRGEIVVSAGGDVQEGWIKVEVLSDPRRRGFVPLSYLRETTRSEGREEMRGSQPSDGASAAAAAGDRVVSPHPASSATRSHTGPARRDATKGDEREGSPASWRAGPVSSVAAVSGAASVKPRAQSQLGVSDDVRHSLLNDPDAVVQAFMKNELHFKQLIWQRQDALAQIRSTLEEAISDVGACKERNATLARKLRDLDQSVEKERKRWKERIEEEKAYISRSLSFE